MIIPCTGNIGHAFDMNLINISLKLCRIVTSYSIPRHFHYKYHISAVFMNFRFSILKFPLFTPRNFLFTTLIDVFSSLINLSNVCIWRIVQMIWIIHCTLPFHYYQFSSYIFFIIYILFVEKILKFKADIKFKDRYYWNEYSYIYCTYIMCIIFKKKIIFHWYKL